MITDLYFNQTESDSYKRYSVTFSCKGENREVYFEVPTEQTAAINHYEDSLLILALHWLMEQGGEIDAHAEINRDLILGLQKYTRIWSEWAPSRYHPLTIKADTVVPRPYRADNSQAIVAFSGGMDASYCIARCLEQDNENAISSVAALMIHGADIPLSDSSIFERVYAQSSENLAELGIPVIPVRTNYREYPHDWEHCFFSVVCAALSLFSGRYAHGIMGTDQTCHLESLQAPWGENPISDQYYSTPYFQLHPMGITEGRTERCATVCKYPVLVRNIRVCWQANANGGNCGVCDKCIRTQLNFMACGYPVDELPFREHFHIRLLRQLPKWDKFHGEYFADILRRHDKVSHALPDEVAAELRKKLALSRNKQYAVMLSEFIRQNRNPADLLAIFFGGVRLVMKRLVRRWRHR